MKTVEQIEKMLDALDQIEELSDEERTDLVINLLDQDGFFSSPEVMKAYFRQAFMREPELFETIIESYRDKWMKMLRNALKQRKREINIVRK